MSVLATVRVVVALNNRANVVNTLRSLMGPTEVERGCISCHLYQDVLNENVLTYIERWECQEDMERHMRSDQYRKLLLVIDESGKPPEVRFDKIGQTEGMEAIWAVRDVHTSQ